MAKLLEIEIMVRMVIPRAVSKADLAEFYGNDPLRCAKELVETSDLTGCTDGEFEIVLATARYRKDNPNGK